MVFNYTFLHQKLRWDFDFDSYWFDVIAVKCRSIHSENLQLLVAHALCLQKQVVAQAIKKFASFYGTQRLITDVMNECAVGPCPERVQPVRTRSMFSHLCARPQNCSFPSGFRTSCLHSARCSHCTVFVEVQGMTLLIMQFLPIVPICGTVTYMVR